MTEVSNALARPRVAQDRLRDAPIDSGGGGVYRQMLELIPDLRRAAFLVSSEADEVLAALAPYPNLEATVFVPATSPRLRPAPGNVVLRRTHSFNRVHALLAAMGPLDVLVEQSCVGQPAEFFSRLFGHVRNGGMYVVTHAAAAPVPEPASDSDKDILSAAARVFRVKAAGPGWARRLATEDKDLADSVASVASVDMTAARTVFVRSGDRKVKLRHTELEFVARHQRNPSWVRLRSATPAREVDAARVVEVDNNRAMRERLYPRTLKVPQLLVREYDDVVAHPYGILQKDHLILPETFRLWMSARQRNGRLPDTSRYFAELPPLHANLPRLPGQFYYLDLEHRFHFGHFMTEALGRLWAWPTAKAANPELRLLVGALPGYQAEILGAFGIAREDITVLAGPVVVESMVSAMPGYCIGRYVSQDVGETYRRIQQGLTGVSGPADERIFLTRDPGLWRNCTNAAELETFFTSRGFVVHRPERYSLAEQAALWRNARVVAGYIGSQMYGQIFSPNPLQLVCFTNASYTSSNEFMMATALGHTLHQFWGVDHPQTRRADEQGRPLVEAHKDYAFDFDEDGPALQGLVDRLIGPTASAS